MGKHTGSYVDEVVDGDDYAAQAVCPCGWSGRWVHADEFETFDRTEGQRQRLAWQEAFAEANDHSFD